MKQLIISLILLLSFAAICNAQPLPPTENPVPLDGGVLGLLVAGADYGVKKVRDKR